MEKNKKTVLITGASRGIGAAAAIGFAKKGYNVCINCSKDISGAEKILEKVLDFSDGLICVCDISDEIEVASMKKTIAERFGVTDILVNNAGIGLFGVFHTLDSKTVRKMYDVNLFGTLNCIRAFLPDMINQKQGSIINVASIGGERGISCESDYSASKAAIIGLTKALAKETGPSGVRVNCISPGLIDTVMNERLTYTDVQGIIDEIPLERIGDPEDIARAILFLASEDASYITGQVLTVDGGWYV